MSYIDDDARFVTKWSIERDNLRGVEARDDYYQRILQLWADANSSVGDRTIIEEAVDMLSNIHGKDMLEDIRDIRYVLDLLEYRFNHDMCDHQRTYEPDNF